MDEYTKIFRSVCADINKLNQLNPFYNFKITRGMCADRLGNTIFPYGQVAEEQIASYCYDYSRSRVLELIAKELEENCIDGAIAEVGVYRGEFACLLNRLFPSKKLYLFDTFEGFSEEQISDEKDSGYAEDSFLQRIGRFAETNIDLVLSKMQSPDSCIVKKGFFPQTAANIDEKFCLVSIDADFYRTTMDALNFFIPRMTGGGYLFMHDYNEDELSGVKAAVKDYEKTHGRLSKVPLSDFGGTLAVSMP
ncbi:MAG: TylF/MycF family methyltransferase [Defluviitaleaceae bacterium]|nr:TylF/MycF family methyltransferase [Defluviitaleaceae bacterium]